METLVLNFRHNKLLTERNSGDFYMRVKLFLKTFLTFGAFCGHLAAASSERSPLLTDDKAADRGVSMGTTRPVATNIGHSFGDVEGGIHGADFSTHIGEIHMGAMDVSGNARVILGDYFETSTHVYQALERSPHKELFEQMKPEKLRGLASDPALVLEFEVATKDFSETMGPGLTSSLYPKALNVYERLSRRGHAVASERYGDHLLLAVQVEIDRNIISSSMFCPPIDYFLGIRKTKQMCGKVRSAYANAYDSYLPETEHAFHLKGKLGDVKDVEEAAIAYYKCKLITYFAPMACCGIIVAIALFSVIGG